MAIKIENVSVEITDDGRLVLTRVDEDRRCGIDLILDPANARHIEAAIFVLKANAERTSG